MPPEKGCQELYNMVLEISGLIAGVLVFCSDIGSCGGPMNTRELLGRRLRDLRKKRGLTIERLAEIADVGEKYLGDIERGKENPTIGTLEKLVNAERGMGKIEQAAQTYKQMNPDQCDEGEKTAWLATGGLLLFRQGEVAEGRSRYQQAIASAKDDPFRRALAASFLAREELLAKTFQASFAYDAAVRASQAIKSKSLAAILDTVLKRIKQALDEQRRP